MIDSHCHFDFNAFSGERDLIWSRCRDRAVDGLLIPGVEPDQWTRARQIADALDNVFFCVGLHPWWIEHNDLTLANLHAALVEHAEHPKCVAIGECGLDALKEPGVSQQEIYLRLHFDVAQTLGLPVVLHSVKSHHCMLQIINEFPGVRGVVHGFSGSKEVALSYCVRGFCLGAGGVITYSRATKTRRAFAEVPDTGFVLETDAPDMPIQGRQGKRNSPEYLPEIAANLAAIRQQSISQIAQLSTENFFRVFPKAII